MTIVLLIYVGVGLLLMLVSVPLIRKQLRPSLRYRVRFEQPSADPAVWYALTNFAGKRLLVTGASTVLAAVVLYLIPGLQLASYVLACSGVFIISLGISAIQTWQYVRAL